MPPPPLLRAGVGFATRQVGNRTKPNLVVSVDEQGTVCMKTQSTFKTTEIRFKLNEPFDETTADDRKTRVSVPGPGSGGGGDDAEEEREVDTRRLKHLSPLQTVVTLENGKLVQKQCWDGKETNIEREISDGKLIAVSNRGVQLRSCSFGGGAPELVDPG